MKFNKEDTLKLIKVIHEFNQNFKNIPGSDNNTFFIQGSRAFTFSESQMYGVYSDFIIGKKDDIVQTLVNNNTAFCVSCKRFFDFQRDYKKNVASSEIINGSLEILTDIPGILYQSENVIDFDIQRETMKEIDVKRQGEKIAETEISSSHLLQLKNINVATTLYINIDSNAVLFYPSEENHLRFRMAYKYFFTKIADGEQCIVSLYDGNLKNKEHGCILELNIKGKKLDSYQFFRVIDY